MKNVYLLLTDLHINFAKENRISYSSEILNAMQDVIEIADSYRKKIQGCSVILMLLGDIFDNSMSNSSDALQANEIFRFFCSMFDTVYAVVGNHEITYARNNPFWFAVSEITDESLAGIARYIQPRGMTAQVIVTDRLTDGSVTFYFNHYGTKPKSPETRGVNIGLFHQNIGSTSICKMWGEFEDIEKTDYALRYQYLFFGHMHLAKGKYALSDYPKCIAEWLGTVGRTKVEEIDDKSLDVNIPAVLVDDGVFISIEDNFITLPGYDACVDKLKLKATQATREKIRERQKGIIASCAKGTLYDTLEQSLKDSPLMFLFELLDDSWGSVFSQYNELISNPLDVFKENTEDPEDE